MRVQLAEELERLSVTFAEKGEVRAAERRAVAAAEDRASALAVRTEQLVGEVERSMQRLATDVAACAPRSELARVQARMAEWREEFLHRSALQTLLDAAALANQLSDRIYELEERVTLTRDAVGVVRDGLGEKTTREEVRRCPASAPCEC